MKALKDKENIQAMWDNTHRTEIKEQAPIVAP
jgi:hypothetical protein